MNIKNFLRKRRFLELLNLALTSIKSGFYSFFKFTFAKRTILFVTNQKIRSITLGPLTQLGIFSAIAFVVHLFMQSANFNNIIDDKSKEISQLREANEYFQAEFDNMNEKLKKVNDYLTSVTGHVNQASDRKKEIILPENLKEESLSKSDKHTMIELKNALDKISNIESIADSRAKKIEKGLSLTGLNLKKNVSNSNAGQGGPLIEAGIGGIKKFAENEKLATKRFIKDMDRLIMLEKLTTLLPLNRPMKSYFISSSFGHRSDPLTHGSAIHHGLDFVGPNKAKIFSPSNGKIILAGKFSNYGNAIVIDHGFGVTTRYGHLSEVKVSKGQMVKKGDVIALQGSTGRSTGQHLHYEIRYKDTPLNPKKFLEAGDYLLNTSSNI